MIGRLVGGALGAVVSRDQHKDPVKGALIGAATMFVARRLLPARIAGIGATLAAGYVAKRLADRELAKGNAAPAPAAAPPRARRSGNSRRTAKAPPANP